jgi:hypothetical protein
VERQSYLLQIVRATHPSSRLAGRLDRGKQQPNQNANDGDHHQKLNQRKSSMQLP